MKLSEGLDKGTDVKLAIFPCVNYLITSVQGGEIPFVENNIPQIGETE